LPEHLRMDPSAREPPIPVRALDIIRSPERWSLRFGPEGRRASACSCWNVKVTARQNDEAAAIASVSCAWSDPAGRVKKNCRDGRIGPTVDVGVIALGAVVDTSGVVPM